MLRLFAASSLLLPAMANAIDLAVMKRLATSLFRIEASEDFGRTQLGSGVMVAPRTLVTNCHVVLTARDISVESATGRFSARVLRAHIDRDLCLLDVAHLEGAAVTLGSTTDKHTGDAIAAVGYAAGDALSWSRGHIEGLFTHSGIGRVIQGSASFDPGKSGGGLFDKHGQLIGILTFKCRVGGPYHFAVPAEWIKTLMRDTSGTAQALADKPFWQHTDERLPVFVRAASLSAAGDCAALNTLSSKLLAREPKNPEAIFIAKRAQSCSPA